MYRLKVNADFDAAHFLKGYEGKCANIHGHRWTVEVSIASETLCEEGSQRGMCVDFKKVRSDLESATEVLDHTLIAEEGSLKAATISAMEDEGFKLSFVSFRPTAENFAKYFYDCMKDAGYQVMEAVVYETPNNCAAYSE